jgi:2-methylcitrate dehydratase PrpD
MGRAEPNVGLEGKFSVQHCIAAGLIDGAAYPAQFSDARVSDPAMAAIRRKVQLHVDDDMPEDGCILRLRLKDGSVLEEHIEHATGSPQNPLSDERLDEKFLTLASSTLGQHEALGLLQRLRHLDEIPNVAGLVP